MKLHVYFLSTIVFLSMLVLTSCGNREYNYGTLTDSRDNKSYKTIDIDGMVWTAENIRYEGGSELSTTLDSLSASRYNPAGDASNVETYGCLYNYKAAETACPEGWHIPSVSEFEKLSDAFSADEKGDLIDNFQCLSAGAFNGTYTSFGKRNYMWTAKEVNSDSAYIAVMPYYNIMFAQTMTINPCEVANKQLAVSVRCVKD